MKSIFTIIFGVLFFNVSGQTGESDNWITEAKLPDWFMSKHKDVIDENKYEISEYINPYYFEEDFNGDKIIDIAVAIVEKSTKKKGVFIYHNGIRKHYFIGAGQEIGNGGDDFKWMDIWKIYRNATIQPGVGETEVVKLSGSAILVEKSESASAVIYWDGSQYVWHQQGD